MKDTTIMPPARTATDDDAVSAAMARFDHDAFRDLLVEMVDTPSPTGDERALAVLLAERLCQWGLEGWIQPLDDHQANAVGRLRSRHRDGPDLLLYAPIDTHLSGDVAVDGPWTGGGGDPFHQPRARVHGNEIAGLGAENPKGFAACVLTAARCVAAAGLDLRGDVHVGLGAGGMPTNAAGSTGRRNIGHGEGVTFMLQQGVRPDYAVIAKPVWGVSWEEVGVTWFRVRVAGRFGYAGIRHLLPYRNPIDGAAIVVRALEAWLPEYAAEHTSGLVAPQGVVGAIRGGYPHKPTFVPSGCDVFLDIRVSPRDDPLDVKRLVDAKLREIERAHDGLQCDAEMILAIPGSHTPETNWIVRSLTRSWEAIEGRPHEPPAMASGATDVAMLRMWGIPTARLGMPRYAIGGEGDWAGEDVLPLNHVHLDDCRLLVEALVRTVIDTCGRTREEIASW